MATNKTLYIKDEDVETWEKASTFVGSGNLSQFLTNYLKEYVISREAIQAGKERIVVRFIENEIPHAQAFYGHWLIPPHEAHDEGVCLFNGQATSMYHAAAITAKNKIVIFNFFTLIRPSKWEEEKFFPGKLQVFDSLAQALNDGIPASVIAAIKTKMGVEVEELDI